MLSDAVIDRGRQQAGRAEKLAMLKRLRRYEIYEGEAFRAVSRLPPCYHADRPRI
jgi:hypothetical protein